MVVGRGGCGSRGCGLRVKGCGVEGVMKVSYIWMVSCITGLTHFLVF